MLVDWGRRRFKEIRRMSEEKIKYPLPCKCAGPKFVSMCPAHQALEIEKHQRMLTAPNRLARAEAILREAIEAKEGWIKRAVDFLKEV